jgi:hypothetical protein
MEFQHRSLRLLGRRKKCMTLQRLSVGSIPSVTPTVLIFLFQGDYRLVLKAQVLAGGRGKGRFDNGFHGGVHYVQRSTPFFSGQCSYSTYTAC